MTQHNPPPTKRGLTIGILALSAGCAIGLSACSSPNSSSGAAGSNAGSTSTRSDAPASDAPKTLTVTVKGRTVTPTPATIQLKTGQTLRLTVTSDHDDELHAHGFNQEIEIKAGQPATLNLRTTVPGLYEVETHNPSLRLLKVLVQ